MGMKVADKTLEWYELQIKFWGFSHCLSCHTTPHLVLVIGGAIGLRDEVLSEHPPDKQLGKNKYIFE